MSRKKVCLLFGGKSTEHSISCRSAKSIWEALEDAGYEVLPVGITLEGEFLAFTGTKDQLLESDILTSQTLVNNRPATSDDLVSPKAFLSYHCAGVTPDIVFPAVHGINCEDGVLQGFLEMLDIPYVGSGVLSSAAGMDKAFAKIVFDSAKIPQVPYVISYRHAIHEDIDSEVERILDSLNFPLFLKPANGGSSVGTRPAKDKNELIDALREVSTYDDKVLVEIFVEAREIEVSVKGNKDIQTAAAGEILKDESVVYYDFETKYLNQNASVSIPAELSEEVEAKIQHYAETAYRVLACNGLARVDFFLTKEGKIYLNEINTLPGFTSISLYPMAWAYEGISMAQLVSELCDYAIEAYEDKRRNLV